MFDCVLFLVASRSRRLLHLIVTGVLAVTSCTEPTPVAEDAGPATEATVTWSDDIRPLVATHCTGCHNTGGTAPFAFETYADVSTASTAMLDAMEGGRMPPWPADPACRSFADERVLDDATLELFRSWVESGAPEGEPTEPLAHDPVTLTPTLSAQAATPYTPDLSSAGDDYRCFLLDVDFDEAAYLQGTFVEPGSTAVHHVLVYALVGDQIERAEQADLEEEGEGYTCFGGPMPRESEDAPGMGGAQLAIQIGGWAPGAEPSVLPDDTGIPIPAGARVVMQVHFSAVGGAPQPDHTTFHMLLHDDPPAFLERTVPLPNPQLDIPAGETDVRFEKTLHNWSSADVTITGFTGHMHLLGTSLEAMVVRPDSGETCGLAIPDWDFDWQLSYRLRDDDTVSLRPNDGIKLTCVYDNSAAHQPVVDGVQQAPRDVTWGEGSLDEMCLLYATVREPNTAPPQAADEGPCAPADGCYAACDGSLSCLLACEDAASACATCAVQAGLSCGLISCAGALAEARRCIQDCVLATNAFGGTMDRCMEGSCPDAYATLTACADPLFAGAACDDPVAACGLTR